MLAAGATDVEVGRKVPGPARPGDEELTYVAVRRPLIEWALRQAVMRERRVAIVSGARVRGVRVASGGVDGADLDDGHVDAQVVIDALGRTSPVRAWLAEQGAGYT